MKKTAKNGQANVKPTFKRPVERYFYAMDSNFAASNKGVLAVGLTLAFFGVMGLIWMVPFPQFDFLVKMNAHTFLNWGSFFIAIVVYCYLKLAPTLSYAMLFSIGIMSYFIVQLEYVERDGGPAVVLVCAVLAIVGLLLTYFTARKSTQVDAAKFLQLLGIGPIWLWSKLFDRLKWKY